MNAPGKKEGMSALSTVAATKSPLMPNTTSAMAKSGSIPGTHGTSVTARPTTSPTFCKKFIHFSSSSFDLSDHTEHSFPLSSILDEKKGSQQEFELAYPKAQKA